MNFTNVPNSLLQGKTVFKKPAQKLLYIYLTSFKNCEKIFPSIDSIAEAVCVTRRTAMTLVQELEDMKLIEVKRVQGGSNVYNVVDYTGEIIASVEASTSEEIAPTSEIIASEPVKELHPKTNNSFKNNNKTNISLTRESIIESLTLEYPNAPVNDIVRELENDSSVVINNVNQFKGLLTYRVKNHKPAKRNVKKSDTVLVDNYEALSKQTVSTNVSMSSIMDKVNAFRKAQ